MALDVKPPQTIEERLQAALNREKALIAQKTPWLDQWQLLGEYVHLRRMDFTSVQSPGEFLNREIFDSSGPKSAKTAASTILAMLWPQSTKRFRFVPPKSLPDTRAIKEYYEKITTRVLQVMDNPEAGLATALDEYMLDQICFGTSGIEILPDPDTKVCYKAWGVKSIAIAENRKGFVDTVYVTVELEVHQIVKEYGYEKCSSTIKGLFDNKKYDEKKRILIAVEPRLTADFNAKGNDAKPFQSIHIEADTKVLLRSSGFSEQPIKVGRFWKILGEVYGRSPGMDALPDILEANAIWEAVTVAIEKSLDPPLGVLDDGKLGGGEIDTSAGAINVFNITGRAGEKNPIFPLFTVGEIKQSVNLIQQLSESISDHFFIDRLLDFNNETRMTLGEANIRNRLRNSTLGSIFTRQIAEVFSPTIQRTFNILFADGELGVKEGSVDFLIKTQIDGEDDPIVIPPEVVKLMESGRDVYDIEYFTPALRIMQAEEADGILRTYEAANLMKGINPEVGDGLNGDYALKAFGLVAGAPSEMFLSKKEIDVIRQARIEAAEEARRAQQLQMATEAMRNAGQSGLLGTPQSSGIPVAA